MSQYADTDDYIEWLSGREEAIPRPEFPFWAKRASEEIDARTFGRLIDADETPIAAKWCACELAEALYVSREAVGIASTSVTGHSTTFDKRDAARHARDIVTRHFNGTGLLYKGVG